MSFCGLLVVAVPPTFLLAGEKSDDQTTKRITHLIGMLASRNAPPRIHGDPRKGDWVQIRFDKAYDTNLQVPVYLAMQELLAEEEAALDLLLKHGDDKRYCLSITHIENDENKTVGEICTRIFWAKILPFQEELHFITKDQWGVYPRSGKSDKEWWKGKKKHGLAKVQIEAIDAMLDFMKKADVKKASPWHPEAKPVTPREFERGRKKNIRLLKAIRETIVNTGKPYRPSTCNPWYDHIIGLPWKGRK